MKDFADDNFKFDKNGRKLSKLVENCGKRLVSQGRHTRYEQFLLFPQCFQKAFFPGASKGVIVWEWVKLECQTLFSESVCRLFRSVCYVSRSLKTMHFDTLYDHSFLTPEKDQEYFTGKILDLGLSVLKACADDKQSLAEWLTIVFERK